MRSTSFDVSFFNIGEDSYLADLTLAEVTGHIEMADGTSLTQVGESPTPLRRSAQLDINLLSTLMSPVRVSGLNLNQVNLNAVDHKGFLKQLTFRGLHRTEESCGLADLWRYPAVVRKSYQADLTIMLDSTWPDSLLIASMGGGAVNVELDLDLNGVQITLPMVAETMTHQLHAGKLQQWNLKLVGQAPVGTYPTAPTAINSLLSAVIVAPETALTAQLVSRATGGQSYSGSFICSAFDFSIERENLVRSRYQLASWGPLAVVST